MNVWVDERLAQNQTQKTTQAPATHTAAPMNYGSSCLQTNDFNNACRNINSSHQRQIEVQGKYFFTYKV